MFRTVNVTYWIVDQTIREMPANAKLVDIYLRTNSHTHVSGLYHIADVTIAHETGLTIDEMRCAFDTLSKGNRVVRDANLELVYVVGMFAEQGRGDKLFRAAANHIKPWRNSSLVQMFLRDNPEVVAVSSDRVSKGKPAQARPSSKEQEQEQDQKAEKKPTAAKSTEPSMSIDQASPVPFRQFTDHWLTMKRRENPAHEFHTDGVHVTKIWKAAKENLDLAKRAIDAYMADRSPFYEGHPATKFGAEPDKWLTRANGVNHGKPTATGNNLQRGIREGLRI